MVTYLYYYLLLVVSTVQSELVIQRVSGLVPDRFTENGGCTTKTCSTVYGAEYLVPNSCQCQCPVSTLTFSIHNKTCIQTLHDCNDLILTDKESEQGIFTILVSTNFHITPSLPIKSQLTGEFLTESMQCAKPYIQSMEYETPSGFFTLLELPTLIIETDGANLTYLQFEKGEVISNHSSVDVAGLLIKIRIGCGSHNTSKCLPLKIHGFQKVKDDYTSTTPHTSSANKPLKTLPPNIPYIIGGTALGVVVLAVLVVACVIGCPTPAKSSRNEEMLQVKRVSRNPSINSTRKHPIAKIIRSLSLADFRGTKPAHRNGRKHPVARTSSLRSNTTVDSGRGRSRSPSTFTYDNKAVTEAVLSYESTQVRPAQELHHQPRLFKTHQEQLSTAKHGMINVPGQTHKEKVTASRQTSPLKRLFMRKGKQSSPASDSQLSIDYSQFRIHDAAAPITRKRFSESHINPDISFNAEGRLAQTEEVLIDLPASQGREYDIQLEEDDLHDRTDGLYNSKLPVTSIDDVSDDMLESGQLYEIDNSVASMDDFVAI